MEQETHTPDLQHPDFSSGSTPAVHLQIQAALHELKRLTGVTLTLPAELPRMRKRRSDRSAVCALPIKKNIIKHSFCSV